MDQISDKSEESASDLPINAVTLESATASNSAVNDMYNRQIEVMRTQYELKIGKNFSFSIL